MKRHNFIRCAVTLLFFLTLYNVEAKAQFYSVDFNNVCCPRQSSSELALSSFAKRFVSHAADTFSFSADPYTNGYLPFSTAKVAAKFPVKNKSHEKQHKEGWKLFSFSKRTTAKKQYPPFFDATDILLRELVRKRLTVCMPLDFIRLTSGYGYRKDPFEKCQKFHDGIDLYAGQEIVYSMLPGKIIKVSYGNTGYGNHIVINHGNLWCLYAHLSKIYVRVGTVIDAGAIVAMTGATGRATSPHLHLKLLKLSENGLWESVDPMPFITFLNNHIKMYNEKFNILSGKDKSSDRASIPKLTVANLYVELKRQKVKYPKIVLAQAILESGWFRSNLTRTHNNIFGIRTRKGSYQKFDSWADCVSGYKKLVQYKFKGRTQAEYYAFLKSVGYASDRNYIYKVREIAEKL